MRKTERIENLNREGGEKLRKAEHWNAYIHREKTTRRTRIYFQLRGVITCYSMTLKDCLVADAPWWVLSFVVCEVFLQLPFCFVALVAFWRGGTYVKVTWKMFEAGILSKMSEWSRTNYKPANQCKNILRNYHMRASKAWSQNRGGGEGIWGPSLGKMWK